MAGKHAVLIIARRDFREEECANPRTALVEALPRQASDQDRA